MTQNQKKLIEKTFGTIGYLSLVIAIGLITFATGWTITHDKDFAGMFEILFDIDEAGIVLYPSIAVSVVAFWMRAFLRAGTDKKI